MLLFDLHRKTTRDSLECYVGGSLVYVKNLKCASTFFGSSFVNCWRWEPILWSDIDWDYHHVFGHMLDPVQRRFKGLAEYINMHNLNELFLNDTNFQNFVTNAVVLDEHTSSYHDTFGQSVYHIDWIPITDYTHNQVIEFTERLMRFHGIRRTKNWDYNNVHRTHPEKQIIQQKLEQLFEKQCYWPQSVQWYLEKDVKLYNHINKKFDSAAETWDKSSWLRI